MQIKILSARVLLTEGCDHISLQTEYPCPYVLAFLPSQPPLALDFEATRDTGADYVREQFGIEPEIVDTRYYP